MTNIRTIDLNTLMEAAFKRVASGKELKYFWNNKDEVVTETRQNIIKTLCCLAAAEDTDDKIEAGNASYNVSEYVIPTQHNWLTTIICFSGRVYLTPVQRRRRKWLDVESRPNNWANLEGDILSPRELKQACEMPAEYNKEWEKSSEITKDDVAFSDLHGFFSDKTDADGLAQYFVFDSTKDSLYTQILGLQNTNFCEFGGNYDVVHTQQELVRAMVAGEEKEQPTQG